MIAHRDLETSNRTVQVQFQHVIRIRNPTRTTGGAQISYLSSSSSDDRPNDLAKTTYSRRSHRKSRYGCRNCKNRRLKVCLHLNHVTMNRVADTSCARQCDETKPECTRCMKIGMQCDYVFSQPQQARSQSKTPPYTADVVAPDMTGTNMSLVAIERSITQLIGSKDTAIQCMGGSTLTNLAILNHFVNGSTESIINPKIKVVMKTGLIRSAFTVCLTFRGVY
jgi:hypothetical protein